MENKKDETKKTKNEVQKDIVLIGGSVVGAIVGLVWGGPMGAVAGASTSPSLGLLYSVLNRALDRRKERTAKILDKAFRNAKLNEKNIINKLNEDDEKTDDFLNLLKNVTQTDPSLDYVLSMLVSETINSSSSKERQRLLIVADAIKNLRLIHLEILKTIKDAGGSLEAHEIAKKVGISEIELRSVVRDLELRGMIKDLEVHPIKWKLRELGENLIVYANKK